MRYRNIKTGFEFETSSLCSAPTYVLVGADTPKTTEPEKSEKAVEEETEKKATVSKATKKSVKRSRK